MNIKLTTILQRQLDQARKSAGRTIVTTLGRGLRIEIKTVPGEIHLTLRREGNYPSLTEWDTVTKHFPFILVRVMPTLEQRGNDFTLSARFSDTPDQGQTDG